jgi:hypothetical protein
MLSRNPGLPYVFARMDLAKERGLGMKSFRSLPAKVGLPLPSYTFEDPSLLWTRYRTPESATPTAVDTMNAEYRAAWQFIATRNSLTSGQSREHLSFEERKAQQILESSPKPRCCAGLGRVQQLGTRCCGHELELGIPTRIPRRCRDFSRGQATKCESRQKSPRGVGIRTGSDRRLGGHRRSLQEKDDVPEARMSGRVVLRFANAACAGTLTPHE